MNKGEKKPAAKVLSIICTVLTGIILVLAAAIIINMIVCRVRNKPVSFFGTSFAIVQTQSMEPYIMTGDLITFHMCGYDDVKEGDYIVFIAGDGFGNLKGQSIVHEAVEITEEGIVTKGKNEETNPVRDKDLVTADNLLGVCTFNSAALGKIFTFISKYGIFIIIAVIAVPFIVGQVIKIVKLSKKKESNAADDNGVVDGENYSENGAENIENISADGNREAENDEVTKE